MCDKIKHKNPFGKAKVIFPILALRFVFNLLKNIVGNVLREVKKKELPVDGFSMSENT